MAKRKDLQNNYYILPLVFQDARTKIARDAVGERLIACGVSVEQHSGFAGQALQ